MMRQNLNKIRRGGGLAIGWLGRVHANEQGDVGLEKLLILAAVALPLLGFLLLFRNELWDWVEGIWNDVQDAGQDNGGGSAL